MTAKSVANPSKLRVSTRRQRLRVQDPRPIQIWVLDVRTPSIKAQVQPLAVAASFQAHQDQALLVYVGLAVAPKTAIKVP